MSPTHWGLSTNWLWPPQRETLLAKAEAQHSSMGEQQYLEGSLATCHFTGNGRCFPTKAKLWAFDQTDSMRHQSHSVRQDSDPIQKQLVTITTSALVIVSSLAR